MRTFTSPGAIQDYLDSIPFNFETDGETCMSPARVQKEGKAHCLEGAMFAAYHLELLGHRPYILSLKVVDGKGDVDHAIAPFKVNGYWGAISKTNHNVLRYRDPVYKNIRELAMSFFHEYFLTSDGTKTMRGYSKPINLNRFGESWKSRQDDMWDIAEYIYDAPHTDVVRSSRKELRKAHSLECHAASIPEWKAKGTVVSRAKL